MAGRHLKLSTSWTTCVAHEHFPSSIESSNQKAGRESTVLQHQPTLSQWQGAATATDREW